VPEEDVGDLVAYHCRELFLGVDALLREGGRARGRNEIGKWRFV